MKNKIKSIIFELAKLLIILIIILNIVSYYKSSDVNAEKLEFEAFSLIDGSTYEIEKNKPLLLHFWATWCPVCEIEAPNIETLSKDYQVVTIAVQSGSDEEVLAYLKKKNLEFKVMNDSTSYYASYFNIKGYPTTIIYDSSSNVKFKDVGYTSTAGLYLRMLLTD